MSKFADKSQAKHQRAARTIIGGVPHTVINPIEIQVMLSRINFSAAFDAGPLTFGANPTGPNDFKCCSQQRMNPESIPVNMRIIWTH